MERSRRSTSPSRRTRGGSLRRRRRLRAWTGAPSRRWIPDLAEWRSPALEAPLIGYQWALTPVPACSKQRRGSEVTRRRGASVRIPIRALHRQLPKRADPGARRGPREGPLRELQVIVASAGPPRRKRSFSQRPGAWSVPRKSGAGTPQATAEPQRPTRETLPQGGRAREECPRRRSQTAGAWRAGHTSQGAGCHGR